MLKPIRILSERDRKALWNIFEYMANESDVIVERYAMELQIMADVLDMDVSTYEKETGIEWNREYDYWEGFDD